MPTIGCMPGRLDECSQQEQDRTANMLTSIRLTIMTTAI